MWLTAVFTFKEALRKKVVLIAVLLTLAFLVLYGTGLHFIGGRFYGGSFYMQMQAVLLFVMGVYLASFLVSALSIMVSVGSIAGEIENGTLQIIAARPLSRGSILLGRFFGQAVMLVIYSSLFFLAMTGLVYWKLSMVVPGLWYALLIFILQPLVLLSLTIFGSVWLPTLGNGILTFSLYALAVVGGMLEQIGSIMDSVTSIYIGVITSLLLPVDAVYRRIVYTVVEHLNINDNGMGMITPHNFLGPFGSMSTPSDWMLIYTILYIAALLSAALYLFKRRDI